MTRMLAALALVAGPLSAADEHHHTAPHGGVLNEIGCCENGHAEVRIADGSMTLWFVGGGDQTGRAVRIPDQSITLTVPAAGGTPARTIVLAAKPLVLAEEKAGDCSCFAGAAPWLATAPAFTATGTVTFRGTPTALTIAWPDGFEADAPAAK